MNITKKFLEHIAYNMRVSAIEMTTAAGSGHVTSALSAADLVAALYFYAMRFDPRNPQNPDNDRFILSKGHAAPIVYAAYKELGVLTHEQILTYRSFDSALEGHLTPRWPYTEAATGSLGIGLSIGVGMALSARIDHRTFKTYVMMGDSEIAEGSVWEAAELAAFNHLDNLIAIVDCNRLGQSTATMHGWHVQRYADKFAAFGWKTFVIDGHNMQQIMATYARAVHVHNGPVVILAKTIKGAGVPSVENKEGYHGKAFKKEELPHILSELAQCAGGAANPIRTVTWQPEVPKESGLSDVALAESEAALAAQTRPQYSIGDSVATRYAYGQALAYLGAQDESIVCLDAEVKNSTFAELFEHAHPRRFIQAFIAEQNMVGMAIGCARRGKIAFASTFGAFFTRAHDQIRMAAIGAAPLRLCGSHAGVSVGEDGPSQMALEDIAMMRAMCNSIVLYPCDAVSAYALTQLMYTYNSGISYLRTTRMETPVIYDHKTLFSIGGCAIVKPAENNARAVIIGAGITLHNALKAHEQLLQKNISVAVIDAYSIKPLDAETITRVTRSANNTIVVVEDHYPEGGLGEAVASALAGADIKIIHLAVNKMPRSGKPEQLMAYEQIDADAIIRAITSL